MDNYEQLDNILKGLENIEKVLKDESYVDQYDAHCIDEMKLELNVKRELLNKIVSFLNLDVEFVNDLEDKIRANFLKTGKY